jgi:hypothetical protein
MKRREQVRNRAIERLGGVTPLDADLRAREAYKSGYYDRSGEDEPVEGTMIKRGYRTSKSGGQREVGSLDPDELLEIAWLLWTTNPIAKRSTELKRDYIVARGTTPQTPDPNLQEILEAFWHGNQLDLRITEFAQQLYLFGEQMFTMFVRKTDGRVRMGYIDPAEIEMVVVNPDNALERGAVIVKATEAVNPWEKPQERRVYRIIRMEDSEGGQLGIHEGEAVRSLFEQDDVTADAAGLDDEDQIDQFRDKLLDIANATKPDVQGKLVMAEQATLDEWERDLLEACGLDEYTGSCFYYAVNAVSNQARGLSDFTQVADYADQHDAILFGLADREQLMNYFSWDVTLTGADDDKVRERAKAIMANPPRRGSVNVHNDSETWLMQTPDVQAAASIESGRAMQLMVLGGLGFPEAWFGKGDETNRATLEGQNDPTWKSLTHDQFFVQSMFLQMLHFVKDQAVIAGTWKPSENPETGEVYDHSITLPMPEMTADDTSVTAGMLSTLASALVVAEEAGWQDAQASREIWAKALVEFGVELDFSKEPEEEPEGGGQPDEQQDEPKEEPSDEEKREQQRNYFSEQGVYLADSEASEAGTFAALPTADQKEAILAVIRRMGLSAETADLVAVDWDAED